MLSRKRYEENAIKSPSTLPRNLQMPAARTQKATGTPNPMPMLSSYIITPLRSIRQYPFSSVYILASCSSICRSKNALFSPTNSVCNLCSTSALTASYVSTLLSFGFDFLSELTLLLSNIVQIHLLQTPPDRLHNRRIIRPLPRQRSKVNRTDRPTPA